MSEPDHLAKAMEIAVRAHAGQVDKAGEPYILHVMRVVLTCKTPEARVAAALHDVYEDGPPEARKWVREAGFPDVIREAVWRLTREKNEDYASYIAFLSRVPLAREVKIADLRDNLDRSRIASPALRDLERWGKYERALAVLTAGEGA